MRSVTFIALLVLISAPLIHAQSQDSRPLLRHPLLVTPDFHSEQQPRKVTMNSFIKTDVTIIEVPNGGMTLQKLLMMPETGVRDDLADFRAAAAKANFPYTITDTLDIAAQDGKPGSTGAIRIFPPNAPVGEIEPKSFSPGFSGIQTGVTIIAKLQANNHVAMTLNIQTDQLTLSPPKNNLQSSPLLPPQIYSGTFRDGETRRLPTDVPASGPSRLVFVTVHLLPVTQG